MRLSWLKDALGLLIAALIALPACWYPFGNDQALHWYIGRRWLEGELPFTSAISSKPIVVFVIHALSTALMGEGMWPIRVTELLTVLGVAYLIAAVARPHAQSQEDGAWGSAAIVFATAYYGFFDYWDTAHPELWEGCFLLAACFVAATSSRAARRELLTGVLVMAAFMTKFPAALPGLAVLAYCLLRAVREGVDPRSRLLNALRCTGRIALGGAAVALACILPFAIAGELGPMWEILYEFIRHYADQARHDPNASTWQSFDRGGALLLSTGSAALGVLVTSVIRRDVPTLERAAFLSLTAALTIGSVVVQGRYFGYHWVVITPLCVAILMLASRALAPRLTGFWSLAAACGLAACVFVSGPRWQLPSSHHYARHVESLLDYQRGRISRATYLRPFKGRARLDDYGLMERVARIINGAARPGDTLCTRGFATPLYPLTGLRCTTRHIVQEIVPQGLPGWPAEYRQALLERPPTFMVTFTDRRPDLAELKRRGYRLLGSENKFAVLTLRPATP